MTRLLRVRTRIVSSQCSYLMYAHVRTFRCLNIPHQVRCVHDYTSFLVVKACSYPTLHETFARRIAAVYLKKDCGSLFKEGVRQSI